MTEAVSWNRRFRDLRYRIFYGLMLNKSFPLECWGNTHTGCGWTFCPTGLDSDSVIYSGGVGNDISFEHELVRHFHSRIVLFDPSPTGLATMQRPEHQIPEFKFVPNGLAGESCTLMLAPPKTPEEGSWYLRPDAAEQIEVPCIDLTTAMKQNGHTHIDLLKLDIEGSEYGVIDHILDYRIPVKQILVEYHHWLCPGVRLSDTVRSILRLRMRGYKLLDQDGTNHTFLWTGPWPW